MLTDRVRKPVRAANDERDVSRALTSVLKESREGGGCHGRAPLVACDDARAFDTRHESVGFLVTYRALRNTASALLADLPYFERPVFRGPRFIMLDRRRERRVSRLANGGDDELHRMWSGAALCVDPAEPMHGRHAADRQHVGGGAHVDLVLLRELQH